MNLVRLRTQEEGWRLVHATCASVFGAPTGWTESDDDQALGMKAKRRAWSSGVKVAAPYIGASYLAISSQTLDHNPGLEYSTGERVSDGQNAVPNSRLVISLVRWQHMPTVSDEDGSKMSSGDGPDGGDRQ